MKDRIKEIRKDNKDSQDALATKLGLTRTYVNLIESGKKIPSDRTIRDISRIYGIDEEWLRTGVGEKKRFLTENEEIAAFLNDAMETVPDDIKRKLVLALAKLDDEDWKKVDALAKKLLNE